MGRRPPHDSREHEHLAHIRSSMWALRLLTLLLVGFLAFALFLLAPSI